MPRIQLTETKKAESSKVKESSLKNLLSLEINLSFGRINLKKKQAFYSDLSVLLDAGIDIITAFELIESHAGKAINRQPYTEIRESVIQGMSLSEAMQQSDKWTMYETFSIKIGEETGRLTSVLKELAIFFSRRIEQQRKVTGAFTYPVLVIFTAFAAVFFMMRFVVPMFEDVFKRFKGELPQLTKVVIYVSHNMGTYLWFLLVILIAIALVVWFSRKAIWYRRLTTSIQLHIPFFGDLIRKIHTSRFCMSMELLISSKTPLNQALSLASKMVTFYPLQLAIAQIEKDIVAGIPLYKSMASFKIFDAKLISLIRVGEEVNRLEQMFSKIKKIYDDEIDHRSAIMGTVMEPLIIVFVGIFVGLVLVAMYLPMFQMSTSIAQ